MNRFFLIALAVLLSHAAIAKQRDITFTRDGENISSSLQQQIKDLRRGDTLSITFGEGVFYMDREIEILAHTSIKGQGASKSRILLLNNGNFKTHNYFCFNGKLGQEIRVEISDLSVDMIDHSDIWWENSDHGRYVFCFLHADSVRIHDITSHIGNARCTTFDMWVCCNVEITRCELVNYNNCHTGGILWFRRDTRDITITDNKIIKYGNDELLAMWDNGNNVRGPKSLNGVKENIVFEGNDILFQRPETIDADEANDKMDVMFAFFNGDEKEDSMSIAFRNIAIQNNNITIDTPISNLMNFGFRPGDTCKDFYITNNNIVYTDNSSVHGTHSTTIYLISRAQQRDTLVVADNNITSDAIAVDKYGNSHRFLAIVDGGSLALRGNTFTGITTTEDGKKFGTALLWTRGPMCDIILDNNTFDGINKIGKFSCDYGKGKARLTARGNTFNGDTRIYNNNMEQVDLTFTGNVFHSDSYEVLLQEFGTTGSLVFTGNDVYAKRGGSIFTHYSKDDVSSMRFDNLVVRDNNLHGIDRQRWVPAQMNARKRDIRSNNYR